MVVVHEKSQKTMPTIQETIQRAKEFAELPKGWHFGDGVPVPCERINQAVLFLQFASKAGFKRANAFPGVAGEIEITLYAADRMLEITIESDSSITIAEDLGHEQVSFEENCSRSDTYRRLEEFGQSIRLFPCNPWGFDYRVS